MPHPTVRAAIAALGLLALCGCSAPAAPGTTGPTGSPSASPSASASAKPLDVSRWARADFASPDGSIRCSLTTYDASCDFPAEMNIAKVPSAKKICPGTRLRVTGVTVSGIAEYFCSQGNDADPREQSSAAQWAKKVGFPTVKVGSDTFVTLPDGQALSHGKPACQVTGATVKCWYSGSKATFTVSSSGIQLGS